jgi:hypothetical protein
MGSNGEKQTLFGRFWRKAGMTLVHRGHSFAGPRHYRVRNLKSSRSSKRPRSISCYALRSIP